MRTYLHTSAILGQQRRQPSVSLEQLQDCSRAGQARPVYCCPLRFQPNGTTHWMLHSLHLLSAHTLTGAEAAMTLSFCNHQALTVTELQPWCWKASLC